MRKRVPMFPGRILDAAHRFVEICAKRNLRVVFAESCTGGLIAAAVTALPGSSRIVDRGFVVYSHESKEQELDVSKALSEQFGAVSEEVAIAMAEGALKESLGNAQVSIAVTGVAGPGSTPSKPVGLVHIAVGWLGHGVVHEKCEFGPLPRDQVREETVIAALDFAMRFLGG